MPEESTDSLKVLLACGKAGGCNVSTVRDRLHEAYPGEISIADEGISEIQAFEYSKGEAQEETEMTVVDLCSGMRILIRNLSEVSFVQVEWGKCNEIDEWMKLVEEISWNYPGLETKEKLDEHKETVLRFMDETRALCVKNGKEITGVLLFSREHNMICCLGVSPEYRRRGIAAKLIEKAINELDQNKDIIVTTFREKDEKGIAPRALYEKFGFIADEYIEEFGYPNQKFVLHP